MDGPENDFIISVDGKDIRCDKDLLAQQSDYFRALFDSQMTECASNKVTLTDIGFKTVAAIVNCMKTEELEVCEDDVIQLAQAAVRFQVPVAIRSCESYLVMSLDDTNCHSLCQLAKSLCLENLYNKTKRHTLYYFTAVMKQQEFFALELEDLIEYLADKHLNCESEVNVLRAVDAWVKHDNCVRVEHLDNLLRCFHAEDLLPSEWDEVLDHPLLTSTESGRNWIRDNRGMREYAVPRHTRKGDSIRPDTEQHKDIGRKPEGQYRQLPLMFLTVGGLDKGGNLCSEICKFNVKQQAFTPFMDLKQIYEKRSNKMGFRVTAIGKDLYITGGQVDLGRSSTFCMDVWKYDGFEEKWTVVTRLKSPRRHHCACAAKSSLYLLGGFGKFRQKLDTFEEYDTVNDEWQELPSCPVMSTSLQTVHCDSKIYVYSMSCLYYYDLRTSVWTEVENDTKTNCLFQIFPCPYDAFIYEFAFRNYSEHPGYQLSVLDLDSDIEVDIQYFYFGRQDTKTRKFECFEADHRSCQYGNKVVVVNGKVYFLNLVNKDFMSWDIHNDSKVQKLGTGLTTGQGCTLIALVKYPTYKLKEAG